MDIRQKDLYREFAKADELSRKSFSKPDCFDVLSAIFNIDSKDLDANAKTKVEAVYRYYTKLKRKYAEKKLQLIGKN